MLAIVPDPSINSEMDIKEIVNDPEWQALRQSFLGTWKQQAEENVAKLRQYLAEAKGDYALRRRRVHNYLTGSAFRIGMIVHPSIDQLLSEIRIERRAIG